MEITVNVKMDKKFEAAIDRLVSVLEKPQGGGCCKEPDPAEELKAKMEAEKEQEIPKDKKTKPLPEDEPAAADISLDDVRKGLSTFSGGDAGKRKQAVELLKKFHPTGKLTSIEPGDYAAILTELAAL
jgi:hypothetical protein